MSLYLLAALPILAWLLLFWSRDQRSPEPFQMLLSALGFGVLSALPLVYLQQSDYFTSWLPLLSQPLWQIIFATLEEVVKFVGLILLWQVLRPPVNQIIDGVLYSVAIALGFALTENIVYMSSLVELGSDQLWQTLLLRSVITTVAHCLFAAVVGFAFAHALLSRGVFHQPEVALPKIFNINDWWAHKLHIIWCHVCTCRPSTKGHDARDLLREGLVIAVLLHIGYNMLLVANLQILVISAACFWSCAGCAAAGV